MNIKKGIILIIFSTSLVVTMLVMAITSGVYTIIWLVGDCENFGFSAVAQWLIVAIILVDLLVGVLNKKLFKFKRELEKWIEKHEYTDWS